MPWYPKLINAEILSVHAAIVPVGSKATVLMFGGDEHNGNLIGPAIVTPPSPYNSGWDYSVIQLPLLPGDNYRSQILAVNGTQPQKIELNLDDGAPTPSWGDAGTRQGSAANKARTFSCPVYLPTGQVLVSGDINGSADTAAVKTPEIYTPDINWNTRTYFDFVSLEEHCHAIASSGFHRSDSLR